MIYDYIILGAGLTGTTVASRLVEKGAKVLLIDIAKPRKFSNDENKKKSNYLLDLNEKFNAKTPYYFEGELKSNLHINKNEDFALYDSLITGGLSNFWTAGCYTFNDEELRKSRLPTLDKFLYYYNEAAQKMGVTQEFDDLISIYPKLDIFEKSTELNEVNKLILEKYQNKKNSLNFILGRSRVAVLTQDKDDFRKSCNYCNQCFWGCTRNSIYNASINLDYLIRGGTEVINAESFEFYKKDDTFYIDVFDYTGKHSFKSNKLVICTGAKNSTSLMMKYLNIKSYEYHLLDNDMIGIPALFFGKKLTHSAYAYQFHQLAGNIIKDEIHFQITASTNLQENLIYKDLPLPIYLSKQIFSLIKNNLLYINFFNNSDQSRRLHYSVNDNKIQTKLLNEQDHTLFFNLVKNSLIDFKKLKILPVVSKANVGLFGSSVHYGIDLLNHDNIVNRDNGEIDKNIFVADGTLLSYIPSKNYSFTLVANAIRIADNNL